MAIKKIKKKKEDVSGIAFVGALFIGMGLGMFYGNIAVGTLIGLGVGFLLMALIRVMSKKK